LLNMRRIKAVLLLILFLAPAAAFAAEEAVELKFFYSPGCRECTRVKSAIMPGIEEEFKGGIRIEYLNTEEIDNYKLLLFLQEKTGAKALRPPVIAFDGILISGEAQIKGELASAIKKVLRGEAVSSKVSGQVDLLARFRAFSPLVVAGSGLIDGINPCAFTVIVFFVSFLSLQGYRKREVLAIGLAFICAVFITYLLLGLGLFSWLYAIRGFWVLVRIFNLLIGALSITLGGLAVYDIYKFRKSNDASAMILQLPDFIKYRIHKVIGDQYRGGAGNNLYKLLSGALATGFIVSLLEAICTGQVYLPTIAFVFKAGSLKIRSFAYLLLYNIMFIIPLLIIFAFALLGVSSGQFAAFLRKHLVSVKVAMALLFFALGIFLVWRG